MINTTYHRPVKSVLNYVSEESLSYHNQLGQRLTEALIELGHGVIGRLHVKVHRFNESLGLATCTCSYMMQDDVNIITWLSVC